MSKPNQLNPLNIKGKSQTYSDFYTYNLSPAESDKFNINYEKAKDELLKLKTEVKTKGQELLHLKIETAEGENELYNNLRIVERIINICNNSVQKEINQFFEKKTNISNYKNKENNYHNQDDNENENNNIENKKNEDNSNILRNNDKDKSEDIINNVYNENNKKKVKKTRNNSIGKNSKTNKLDNLLIKRNIV